MKKIKIFGIGVGVMMIMLAAVPAVYGAIGSEGTIPHNNGMEMEEIVEIFAQYENELAEIETFIQSYIAEHGCIDEYFELPPDLQQLYDGIIENLQEYIAEHQGQIQPLGGGRNGFEVELFVELLGFGLLYKIWLDHFWTTIINYLGPAGAGVIAIIISIATGGIAAPVAIGIAVILIAFGIDFICDQDQGNGVHIRVKQYIFPPGLWLVDYVGPQQGLISSASAHAEALI